MAFNVAKIASARASLTISLTKSLRVAGPLVWTHRPIGLTAPSKLDLQPHLGFAPLDKQIHQKGRHDASAWVSEMKEETPL